MAKWKPNKEILEEMLEQLEAMPNKDKKLPYAGVPDERICSIRDIINELASGTELGKEMYVHSLELRYFILQFNYSRLNL